MQKDTSTMEKIVALCKRRGFIFQSSEIYGGIGGFWDYGPLGVEFKQGQIGRLSFALPSDELEQEPESVSVGGNRLVTDIFLVYEIGTKEVMYDLWETRRIGGVIHFSPP